MHNECSGYETMGDDYGRFLYLLNFWEENRFKSKFYLITFPVFIKGNIALIKLLHYIMLKNIKPLR